MLEIQQCTQGLSYVSVYKQCFIKKVYLQQQQKKTKQNKIQKNSNHVQII